MSDIEAIIILLLLFMAVPDVCRKLGRPALAFSMFVLFGIVLGPFVDDRIKIMVKEAGQVGFLLLLFEVGLEIELPRFKELLKPLRFAGALALAQYPLFIILAEGIGLNWMEALIAAAALTGCSVGMAHSAWKHFKFIEETAKSFVLQVMVLLELIAIVLLSVETAVLEKGLSWPVAFKLAGITITVFLVARFSGGVTQLFRTILERTTHWRVHFLVLLVLAICALGDRLGLSAAKTAFFLGLFMSRIEHEKVGLEEYMAPISHRFLIPIFFVALGLHFEWGKLVSLTTVFAIGTAGLLMGFREVLQQRWFRIGSESGKVFLLFCPNLTIAALAASVLFHANPDSRVASWLLLTSLIFTIGAILRLPAVASPNSSDPGHGSAKPG